MSAKTHADASALNRKILGKGITIQCWGICPKIREVDELLRSDAKARTVVREGHPEVSFHALAGGIPMVQGKSRGEGSKERATVLRRRWPTVDELIPKAAGNLRSGEAGQDDILDAAAMYLTAAAASLQTIPETPERDSAGLAMEIVIPG